MRPGRLLVVSMLALAAGGCAHTPPPWARILPASRPAAVSQVAVAPQADLDGLMYQGQVARPVVAPVAVATPMVVAPPIPAVVPAVAVADEIDPPYTLDTGDKLRIVVFGQEGLINTYVVNAAGNITMPLIGAVHARSLTTDELARAIADRLRRGYLREPHVAIEIDTYRPFFILGEVTFPGQYAYVPNMTVETAVAIGGGFTPRAYRWDMQIDSPVAGGKIRSRRAVELLSRVRPGDTVIVKERWF